MLIELKVEALVPARALGISFVVNWSFGGYRVVRGYRFVRIVEGVQMFFI